ncbi:hypothetical protein DMH12_15365 [Streptomyces sp. WAC 04229]|uniref:hypothetical protein n=1 Tax=Streptomyces sp. WAC 04229 TaxID=2203206 RepID=UPI000F735A09|nr:hypothetical protein [Streptomyces sp. WAC 04229]RSN55596.1 hypothetical protein DMH12_15365 [Streptomyces sp. WAC 04229]
MGKYHKAGDQVRVLEGPESGQTLTVSSVRMFATDNGYYLKGGSGLYSPHQVELAAERITGNPCGAACVERKHDLIGVCDHCRGECRCWLDREMAVVRAAAADRATDK